MKSKYDVAVVGGAGHVGIPLSLVCAERGLRTLIYDVNAAALVELKAGWAFPKIPQTYATSTRSL